VAHEARLLMRQPDGMVIDHGNVLAEDGCEFACPGRAAAFSTLLRRAGTVAGGSV